MTLNDERYRELSEITGLSPDTIRERIAGGGLKLSPEQAQELNARGAQRQLEEFEHAAEEGDYLGALFCLDSHEVAAGIVGLDDTWGPLHPEELRAVLREEWARCDGGGDHRAELLELFRRAGYVSDTGRTFTGELVVYRGNLGEDPRLGLSWTISKAKARWFALYALNSPRAWFLGLSRADGEEPVPTVWRGAVDADDVIGYFGGRRESEVVLDPSSVRDVEAILHPRPRSESL